MRVIFTELPTGMKPVNSSMTRFAIQGNLVLELHDPDTQSVSEIRIDEGFITDFATVPRPLRLFVPPMGKYSWATVVHDYLLQEGFNVGFCRTILKLCMKALKVPAPMRNSIIGGVWLYDTWGRKLIRQVKAIKKVLTK